MSGKQFDVKGHIAALNIIRVGEGDYSRDTLRKRFRLAGIPSNLLFWTVFSHSHLIEKIAKDKFRFIERPIHYQEFAKVYDVYRERCNVYSKRSSRRKKIGNLESNIQDAIQLLKTNGYTILKNVEFI
jgi:hypothetical protein